MTMPEQSTTSSSPDRTTALLGSPGDWLHAWRALISPAEWIATTSGEAAEAPLHGFMPLGSLTASLTPWVAWSLFSPATAPLSARVVPERLLDACAAYAHECLRLWQRATVQNPGAPELSDRRFKSDAWKTNPLLGFIAAGYLAGARHLDELVNAVDADAKTRGRVRFVVQQWLAAVAPSNFLLLNPDAQKSLLDSNGESLRRGVMNLLTDITRGKLSQTDESRFVVGENLANTEGSVVFENDLIQLIQYTPRAATVYERPLLIVPPCINKFYILDLQPESSLVRHALDEGHQVFAISWRNPDASLAHKTWDDYVEEGILQTINAVRKISGSRQVNALGFCVGGTMLATALAVLAARGEHPAASMTLLTAMLDFSDTGVLDVFVDEAYVQMREQTIGGKNGSAPGLMRGIEFANAFSFLRPNDLVWNYVVDNYLKGRTPVPFDLLYWNSDSTSLPGPMYVWYLRNTYLENRLREPGALTTCGESIDLSTIDVPTFIYGSREDHIVPWQTAYASVPLLTGPMKFVLGASGHIAGVINPPAKKKRNYWVLEGDARTLPESPDEWLDQAAEVPGSWWPEWTNWLEQYGGKKVKPRAKAGSAEFPVIEPAPGRYVRHRE
ncbi:class I poly(R)-hydroxyalkanoic acid synthase [Paraburkholderia sediminicola]|uniref:class I poly(R)-hydroxyalkanoic acid synthase n=1 Tax=Paraburkholderia sediminicola TaxID=458836 RepID=UPI0038BA6DBA